MRCLFCHANSPHVKSCSFNSYQLGKSIIMENNCESPFRTVMLEKMFKSPLDSKEVKPVNLKEINTKIFVGRTDAEAKVPILWPPHAKGWLTGKDPNAGKDWGQKEKGATEDEMVGWHHRCNGHEFELTLGDSEGQGSLACYSLWGHKEQGMT